MILNGIKYEYIWYVVSVSSLISTSIYHVRFPCGPTVPIPRFTGQNWGHYELLHKFEPRIQQNKTNSTPLLDSDTGMYVKRKCLGPNQMFELKVDRMNQYIDTPSGGGGFA